MNARIAEVDKSSPEYLGWASVFGETRNVPLRQARCFTLGSAKDHRQMVARETALNQKRNRWGSNAGEAIRIERAEFKKPDGGKDQAA